jgi:hypothetical protein
MGTPDDRRGVRAGIDPERLAEATRQLETARVVRDTGKTAERSVPARSPSRRKR